MKITQPFPNTEIVLLKEFATKKEAETVHTYLESMYHAANEKDDTLRRNDLKSDFNNIMIDLNNKYQETARSILDFPVEPEFSTLHNYVYWETGKEMLPHYDNVPGEHLHPVMYGCVLYLNDNFTGGQLWYPNLGVEYTPVAGELIIHPGHREYSHGIRKVTEGIRISAASFITQKDESDDEYGFEY